MYNSEQKQRSERRDELFRAGMNSRSPWSQDLWELYVGFGLIGSLCWFAIVVGAVVNNSFSSQDLVNDVKSFSYVVIAVSGFLALIFIPGARGKNKSRLLAYIALPLSLVLVVAAGLFLYMLDAYPVQTEFALAEKKLGKYPCREWGMPHPVVEQAKWWVAFINRYAGTAEADRASAFLVANIWALDYEAQKIELVKALVMTLYNAPDRHRRLAEELTKRAEFDDAAGRMVRELLYSAESPEQR